jgi:hypothetical protein
MAFPAGRDSRAPGAIHLFATPLVLEDIIPSR